MRLHARRRGQGSDRQPPLTSSWVCLSQATSQSGSRRRSDSIAARSDASVTPSSRATCPHRIGRRLDFRETGHFEQASTSRSSFAGRCFAAHLWQVVRSENTRPCIVNTRPARNHAWKWRVSPSGSCISIIVEVFNNCCNVSPRSAVRETAHARPTLGSPMASQARLAAHSALPEFTFAPCRHDLRRWRSP